MNGQDEKKQISRTCGRIILAGNPNVGKSVIFNRLTGKYVTVSNYPGTTVDITEGVGAFPAGEFTVIDTPGTDNLIPSSEDERVTRDVLFAEKPKCIIHVADSKNLQRTIMFAIQLAELGESFVIDLNMADEAEEKGIKIDAVKLSSFFGVPVVKTVGVTGDGIQKLKESVAQASNKPNFKIEYARGIEEGIKNIMPLLPENFPYKRPLALMLLAGDESAYKFIDKDKIQAVKYAVESIKNRYYKPPGVLIFEERQRIAGVIAAEAGRTRNYEKKKWEEYLGNALLRPFPGIPAVLAALFVMYEFVGVFGAQVCVDFLQKQLFGNLINPLFTKGIGLLNLPVLFSDLIVGKYGLVTMALTYSLAIIFPIVSTFFIFFGLLEDSGYLPRLSIMLDRVFRLVGLNGKAVLPIVLGLGCGTMATLTTRILETKKERIMVTFLLALGVPCSAQLGVILAMLGGISLKYTLAWIFIVTANLLITGFLLDKIVKGKRAPFLIEVPPVRAPKISNILIKVRARIVWYLKEAVPLFILGTFILFLLDKTGALKMIETALRPVVYNLLGLPAESAFAFIVGFLRRDYGAAGFYSLQKAGALSAAQVLVAAIVITLFIPCIAQFFMMVKERGTKVALFITSLIMIYAVAVGAFLNYGIIFLKRVFYG